MKKTFIRRAASAVIALLMVTMPIPSGSFNIETDLATAEAAETSVTNIDTEANSDSGGGKIFQSGDNNGEGWFP